MKLTKAEKKSAKRLITLAKVVRQCRKLSELGWDSPHMTRVEREREISRIEVEHG